MACQCRWCFSKKCIFLSFSFFSACVCLLNVKLYRIGFYVLSIWIIVDAQWSKYRLQFYSCHKWFDAIYSNFIFVTFVKCKMFIKAMWFSLFKVHQRCHLLKGENWHGETDEKLVFDRKRNRFSSSAKQLTSQTIQTKRRRFGCIVWCCKKFCSNQSEKKSRFFSPSSIDFIQKKTSLAWGKENFFKWYHTATCFSLQFSNANLRLKRYCLSNTIFEQIFHFFFCFDRISIVLTHL